MKMIIILTSIIMLLTPQNEKKKILFFGDSITQAGVNEDGYITQIGQIIAEEGRADEIQLIGKGIGGNKVYDLYYRMQEDVLDHSPDVVIIYIGVNDIWHKQTHLTGTDSDKFVKFYERMVQTFQQEGIRLILCTPGVIGERIDYSNPQDGDLNYYSELIEKIAHTANTGFCDLRGVMLSYQLENNKENLDKGILTSDRVHLNKKGNELVAKALWKEIKKIL